MRLILLALSCSFLMTTATAQTFSSLEERMSAAEFKAAGLDKLSPDELARLNAWLRTQPAAAAALTKPAAATFASSDRRGFVERAQAGDEITSRILGPFMGWSGTTTFRLENGMVWQSTDASARLEVKLDSPVVTLKPGFFDTWYLKVEGYNSTVKVKRIE